PVFDAVDTVKAALEVFAGMFREAGVNPEACARAVADPMLLATDLADYLVRRGVPFRKAHEFVGRAVALCAERQCSLPELALEDYQAISSDYAQDLYEIFDLRKAMSGRKAIGAPSPENVTAQLKRWQLHLSGRH